jgi:glyoxylase-like metal-dependent hydrolase (beta-lactamase superfamily II)
MEKFEFGSVEIFSTYHKKSKCFLVHQKGVDQYLLIDTMWTNSYGKLSELLAEVGASFSEIKAIICTHIHMDHAGLAGRLNANGVPWLVTEKQLPMFDYLNGIFSDPKHDKRGDYVPMDASKVDLITSSVLADLSSRLGLQVEIVETPGHTDDSLSVIINGEIAFVGDLPDNSKDEALTQASWAKLDALKLKYIFSSHHELEQK